MFYNAKLISLYISSCLSHPVKHICLHTPLNVHTDDLCVDDNDYNMECREKYSNYSMFFPPWPLQLCRLNKRCIIHSTYLHSIILYNDVVTISLAGCHSFFSRYFIILALVEILFKKMIKLQNVVIISN